MLTEKEMYAAYFARKVGKEADAANMAVLDYISSLAWEHAPYEGQEVDENGYAELLDEMKEDYVTGIEVLSKYTMFIAPPQTSLQNPVNGKPLYNFPDDCAGWIVVPMGYVAMSEHFSYVIFRPRK